MNQRGRRWVWLDHVQTHVRGGALNSHAGHVAHILAVHYVNQAGQAWPSHHELMAATGLSVTTVKRALWNLEQQGLLHIRHGARRGNIYTLQTKLNGVSQTPIGGKRKSVSLNGSKASHTDTSHLSDDGDLVLTCSRGPTDPYTILIEQPEGVR